MYLCPDLMITSNFEWEFHSNNTNIDDHSGNSATSVGHNPSTA